MFLILSSIVCIYDIIDCFLQLVLSHRDMFFSFCVISYGYYQLNEDKDLLLTQEGEAVYE